MTLRNRISLLVSLLFTFLFGIASAVIYISYSNFREAEFKDRLEIKALSTIKLLSNVKHFDQSIMKMIDQNSINTLYDEKTLIFDSKFKLIYSSIDDSKINWSIDDLKFLKVHKKFIKKQNSNEYLGVMFDTNTTEYYVLISANDNYGNRKLVFLKYILIASYLVFTTLCWILTSWMVKKVMQPLNSFLGNIKKINENNLDSRIAFKKTSNEIDLLANEFNFMMDRIEISYSKQKEFTAHASHELRTPLTKITAHIENTILNPDSNSELKNVLQYLLKDINHLTELINSLLILSKVDSNAIENKEKHRLDEIIFASIEKTIKMYPDFNVHFEIEENDNIDTALNVEGNNKLLEIAITNVLKNAYVYSDNKQAIIKIGTINQKLSVAISNSGKTLTVNEQKNLFEPFMRGVNAQGTVGFGLGLRIVQRILVLHNASIVYKIPEPNLNLFQLTFRF